MLRLHLEESFQFFALTSTTAARCGRFILEVRRNEDERKTNALAPTQNRSNTSLVRGMGFEY